MEVIKEKQKTGNEFKTQRESEQMQGTVVVEEAWLLLRKRWERTEGGKTQEGGVELCFKK
jgi:hypothetical protein